MNELIPFVEQDGKQLVPSRNIKRDFRIRVSTIINQSHMKDQNQPLDPTVHFTSEERVAIIKVILNFQSPPPDDYVDPEITPELIQATTRVLAKLGVTWEGTIDGVSSTKMDINR